MPDKPLEEIRESVGERYTTIEGLEIEQGKVQEFANALRDDDPLYGSIDVAKDRGFDRIPAPLTFTRISFFDHYRPSGVEELRPFDLGFRKGYQIHGSQEYEFERPVFVGDELTGSVELTDVFQREGGRGGLMTFAIFEITYRDQNDELVLTERQTIIETEGAIDDDDDEDADAGGGTDSTGGDS